MKRKDDEWVKGLPGKKREGNSKRDSERKTNSLKYHCYISYIWKPIILWAYSTCTIYICIVCTPSLVCVSVCVCRPIWSHLNILCSINDIEYLSMYLLVFCKYPLLTPFKFIAHSWQYLHCVTEFEELSTISYLRYSTFLKSFCMLPFALWIAHFDAR